MAASAFTSNGSTHAQELVRLGLHYDGLGRAHQAQKFFEKAFYVDPWDSLPLALRGLARRRQSTDAFSAVGDEDICELSIRKYATLAARDGGDVAARVLLAVWLREAGESEKAYDELSEVMTLSPHNVPAMIVMGNCLSDLGRLSEAAHCQSRALQLEPDNAVAHLNLAALLLALGEVDGAECHCQSVLAKEEEISLIHRAEEVLREIRRLRRTRGLD